MRTRMIMRTPLEHDLLEQINSKLRLMGIDPDDIPIDGGLRWWGYRTVRRTPEGRMIKRWPLRIAMRWHRWASPRSQVREVLELFYRFERLA